MDHVPPEGGDGAAPPTAAAWWVYKGTGRPRSEIECPAALLPDPPPWRRFGGSSPSGGLQPPPPDDDGEAEQHLGPVSAPEPAVISTAEVDAVNASLFLRRPLIVTGPPGIGKTSLAYKVARELRLGRVLRWEITTQSELGSGLYRYDAIERLRDVSSRGSDHKRPASNGPPDDLSQYFRLGPLGTALLPYEHPRVLLVDELDKSDPDLANNLLHVLEKGRFQIPEIANRMRSSVPVSLPADDPGHTAEVHPEKIMCRAFPIVVITSNGERVFPSAFLRRCIQLHLDDPGEEQLADMLRVHFAAGGQGGHDPADAEMIAEFLEWRRRMGSLAVDQLLNNSYLRGFAQSSQERERIVDLLYQRLSEG
ncbi:MoxR family ATPase [Streptomonospora arabica]